MVPSKGWWKFACAYVYVYMYTYMYVYINVCIISFMFCKDVWGVEGFLLNRFELV